MIHPQKIHAQMIPPELIQKKNFLWTAQQFARCVAREVFPPKCISLLDLERPDSGDAIVPVADDRAVGLLVVFAAQYRVGFVILPLREGAPGSPGDVGPLVKNTDKIPAKGTSGIQRLFRDEHVEFLAM